MPVGSTFRTSVAVREAAYHRIGQARPVRFVSSLHPLVPATTEVFRNFGPGLSVGMGRGEYSYSMMEFTGRSGNIWRIKRLNSAIVNCLDMRAATWRCSSARSVMVWIVRLSPSEPYMPAFPWAASVRFYPPRQWCGAIFCCNKASIWTVAFEFPIQEHASNALILSVGAKP